jgi:hypothetical protein
MEIFHTKQNNSLETVAGICLRCFVLSVCLMLLWFIFFLVGKDWAYSIHSRWFEISRHDFDVIIYCSIAFFKMAILLFFLLPYISIKLILRKKR